MIPGERTRIIYGRPLRCQAGINERCERRRANPGLIRACWRRTGVPAASARDRRLLRRGKEKERRTGAAAVDARAGSVGSVILSKAKDLKLRSLRSFGVFAPSG